MGGLRAVNAQAPSKAGAERRDNMPRLSKYDGMTMDKIYKSIIEEFGLTDDVTKALEEAFRAGWERSENYAFEIAKARYDK